MADLKPNQAEAAHTIDRHISVTAGPGAGKTTVLVDRYLHILRSVDISLDQIVAITFTNRAANEMRERLRRDLDRLLRESASRERPRWMRYKRTLDGAIITTIHGFCARLLREFPVEAALDPQFALLDEHQSAMLEESIVEEVLTQFINAGHESITRLAAGFGRQDLAGALIGIYRSMRNQGLSYADVARRTGENHATPDDYARSLEQLDARMSELFRARGLTRAAQKDRRDAERRWPQLLEALSSATASLSLAEYCQAIEDFRLARPTASGTLADLVRALDDLIWERKLGGLVPRLYFDLLAREYAAEMLAVVAHIETRLADEKRRLSALDFDDLQLRVLKLLDDHPEALRRASGRYRYFLVDEFQDTNSLQRDLMTRLALGRTARANLFIVGDRKQSIYGFRGADVDVFREMTAEMESAGGKSVPLNLNFRSQAALIGFFNHLFKLVFAPGDELSSSELGELGYVEHEPSEPQREALDPKPLVELLVDLRPDEQRDKTASRPAESARERDAGQLAARITTLVAGEGGESARKFDYRDIALLFRAMTEVSHYESAFRRAGIPYQTVQGKGFYEREEITDLIQLLRVLDNRTDELALAAVLRSPLGGVSDDALLALRAAPLADGDDEQGRLRRRRGARDLFDALRHHRRIDFIDPRERPMLDAVAQLLDRLLELRSRVSLSELLRSALRWSEYRAVIAATFDGAQRLANVEKLLTLAERFERSGAHTIRDFVRFVRDFEKAGGRESEGQIDDAANAVRLMTIHQAKGLEFPVVIIPELQRQLEPRSEWYILDRHRGLTLKIPDGRGGRVAGHTMERFRRRQQLRERFESMRLLYVAGTRARDRLILSGAAKGPPRSKGGSDSWLAWIWRALDLDQTIESRMLEPVTSIQVQVTMNLLDRPPVLAAPLSEPRSAEDEIELTQPIAARFPLLGLVPAQRGIAIHRFTVTQLMNYQRCPRQYYFDRVLHAPTGEEIAVWNDAEAPEPPSNLTATLRGAVIHRFCEKYAEGEDVSACLRSSFDDVLRLRLAELGDRLREVDPMKAIDELMPLARNYIASRVRERIERAAALGRARPAAAGVFSERRFRLRRPLGILTGTIDKLLIRQTEDGEGLSAEIIDFKTNRFRTRKTAPTIEPGGQLLMDFSGAAPWGDRPLEAEVEARAADYRLQMQAYALAVRELIPDVERVTVTLHFLDPDIEATLPDDMLERYACAEAIDLAAEAIVSSASPDDFPVRPEEHCRICNFADFCTAGRKWLAGN
ncbi:MAG TPA: UvrD-helicase domain-containing protein [Blastocatellia bacterium]|nr:UvrD-helicase domain-containing protein [Blastocatellia bacterium]